MFTWRAQRVEKEAGRRQTKHLPNAEEEGTTIYSGESGDIATEVATEAVEEDSRRRRRLPSTYHHKAQSRLAPAASRRQGALQLLYSGRQRRRGSLSDNAIRSLSFDVDD